jgi:hypothetical protein
MSEVPRPDAARDSGRTPYVEAMTDLPGLLGSLHDGATVTYLGTDYTVARRDGGTLVLPSGQVVACDPLTVRADAVPLATSLPPGRYPVVSWILHDPVSRPRTYDVAYTAALQLLVRDGPVAAWEPAVWRGDASDVGADCLAVYAVDRGVACFMDLEAAHALATWDEDRVDRILVSQLAHILVQQVDPDTGANVVVSDCGGDGCYGVWTGRTVDGDVACFLTDFVELDGEPAGPVDDWTRRP